MQESFYKLYLERCKRFHDQLWQELYPESVPLNAEYATSDEPIPFARRKEGEFRPISEGGIWGETWQSAWFRLYGTVPKNFPQKDVCLQIRLGGESQVFDSKGLPLCGLTGGSIFSDWYYKELYFPKKAWKPGEKIEFWVEAAANGLMGVDQDKEHPFGHYLGKVQTMRISIFDRDVWRLATAFGVVLSLTETLKFGDYRSLQMLEAMQKACDVYSWNRTNAKKALAELQVILQRPALSSALTAWSVGHAHIDVGWLWPVRESIRKAGRTFSSQIDLIERYPEYIFGASQPALYQMVEENYPALFKKIQEQVAAGRWEPQGGMWVEADCNVTSGESLVRQFLHGKNYFLDKFGFEVKSLWLPDVFGYAASLPQIIKKSGCDFFLTQKLSWSQFNKFPHTTFRWKGLDGTEVLTHFPPENTYNALVTPETRINAQNNFQEPAVLDSFISLYGVGNGGGGPNDNYLERGRLMENLEGCPKHKCARSDAFFQHIAPAAGALPSWTGELYLEFHRGTLTTQGAVKRGNRKCEELLTALEFLASMLPIDQYPAKEMDRLWKTLLTNQFHDILPGSSIKQVYDRTHREHQEILNTANQLCEKIAGKLFRKAPGSLVLANTLSYPTEEICVLPDGWQDCGILDENGQELPVQQEAGTTLLLAKVPAGGFVTLHSGPKKKKQAAVSAKSKKEPASLILENELIRYEFAATGLLVSAWDKECERELLDGVGNDLQLYHDKPANFDAWDVDIFYRREGMARPVCQSAAKTAEGPVRSALTFTYTFGQSSLRQVVSLRPDSKRLDFITTANWQESNVLLRTGFDAAIQTDEANFDIQYATLKRNVHDNTSWDVAKFETSCQKFFDLSDRQYGIAILNDCKYGCRVKDSRLELTLLRSPKYPDPSADLGNHEFTYSFLPHTGALNESQVRQEAAALNRPPLLFTDVAAEKIAAPFRLEADGITLEVVKKAEKDNSLILRLVETQGKTSQGILTAANPKCQLSETNLIEWEHGKKLKLTKGQVKLTLKPFEILTLRAEEK